jgi:hypothetical protein
MHAWSILFVVAAFGTPPASPAAPPGRDLQPRVIEAQTGAPGGIEPRARDRKRPDQVEQVERVTRTVRLGPRGWLAISNVSGTIEVRAGGRDTATLEVVKRGRGPSAAEARRQLELVDVEILERGDRVDVRTRYRTWGHRHDARVEFTVTVPAGTHLAVRSVSGDIEVSGVTGEVDAEAISGTVRLRDVGRVSRARTVAGDVLIDGARVDGTLEASTTSGRVVVRRVRADRLELASVSGDLEIGDCTVRALVARSLSGQVRFAGALERGGRYEFRTHSGAVDLRLVGDVGFELDAGTFSGPITSEWPLRLAEQRARPIGRSTRGVYGDGSAVVEVTTFSGAVAVRKP